MTTYTIHPPTERVALAPDETIVWKGVTRGYYRSTGFFLLLAAALLAPLLFGALKLAAPTPRYTDPEISQTVLYGYLATLGLLAVSLWYRNKREPYTIMLTKKRLLIVRQDELIHMQVTPAHQHATDTKNNWGRIASMTAKRRGGLRWLDIHLTSPNRQTLALYGLDDPAALARLIVSTLKLPVPIKDATT